MELSGRPLFDNPVDAGLFVRREEAGQLEANCRSGVNTLVLGGRGMGKTSLMRYVLYRLRESEFPAVGVDAASAETVLDLLRLVSAALGRFRFADVSVDSHTLAGLGEVGAILKELRGLRPDAVPDGDRTAIFVDLPSGNRTMHQLFGRFRDELWQLPYTWVVVAPKELRVDLLTPPADAFFEDVVQLGPLAPAQQAELIDLRLEAGERAPWERSADVEGNPRRLIEIVRESARSGRSPDSAREASAALADDLERLGPAASRLYEELEAHGPASASDEDLLDRLGWSRQRAAQVLSLLEREGLVSSQARPAANGRPRKVFVIVPSASR